MKDINFEKSKKIDFMALQIFLSFFAISLTGILGGALSAKGISKADHPMTLQQVNADEQKCLSFSLRTDCGESLRQLAPCQNSQESIFKSWGLSFLKTDLGEGPCVSVRDSEKESGALN